MLQAHAIFFLNYKKISNSNWKFFQFLLESVLLITIFLFKKIVINKKIKYEVHLILGGLHKIVQEL